MKKGTLLFFAFFCLMGCENKISLEPYDFQKKMENKGYIVEDVTSKNSEEVTSTALVAINQNYEVDFYKLNSAENADSTYHFIRSKVEEEKKKESEETILKKKNHDKYILENQNSYTVVSKIDNTILYISVPKKHKLEAINDLKNLGY